GWFSYDGLFWSAVASEARHRFGSCFSPLVIIQKAPSPLRSAGALQKSFCSVNPQMPAPARSKRGFKGARQQTSDHRQPALIKKVDPELQIREVFEQISRFLR